jgi:hypothetical protein
LNDEMADAVPVGSDPVPVGSDPVPVAFDPVARVAAVMRGTTLTWSLCGGWAVDAWLDRQTRDHGDVDVAVFRDEERAVYAELGGRRLVAHDTDDADHDEPWDGRDLDFPAHLHARLDDGPDWELQVNERAGDVWLLSREPLVTAPLDRFAQRSPRGLPTMAPEVLLWYKARGTRPRDEVDFAALLPLLTEAERGWLRDAIAAVDPAHRWLVSLGT